MHNRIRNMILIIGEHLLFVVLSLFLVYTFANLMSKHMIIVSVITGFLYLSSTYSAGWSVSSKDYGRAREEVRLSGDADKPLPYSIYTGFIDGIPNLVLSVALMILALTVSGGWEVFYRLYNYSFIYIITDSANNLSVPMCIVASLLVYVVYGVGYIFGKEKKVFLLKYFYKLVYKSGKKGN